MMKQGVLIGLLLTSVAAIAETDKPHFVAKPSSKSVLGKTVSNNDKHNTSPSTGVTLQQGEKVYHYLSADGGLVFSDHAPQQGHYQVLLFDCYACKPQSNINWNTIPLFTAQYQQQIAMAARAYRLEPALIRAVIHAESAFKSTAVSKTGAQGLMQLMPATAGELGVSDAFHPEQNILAGSRYLALLLKRFDGDIALACAAYNAGASRVEQYNGVPPYPETQAYVERVQILLKRYRRT
ncbi:Lytic transglycosylase catalytic [Shewanella halifaxensis HAW-EB4]|uniref:Lytic transglycosylase catalytic n=1 Tax=Shewanella halifaxensis (strain HAW-EB4) TaxID=458817 RepID=B0TN69_SHEHH|nr:lytic transglycosylase domain-containing protein [Shewanella halifaxensis]ABZ74781.1 Lytic transglycosylase catalytic [Shewanella halifaxensis HAW-EB4]